MKAATMVRRSTKSSDAKRMSLLAEARAISAADYTPDRPIHASPMRFPPLFPASRVLLFLPSPPKRGRGVGGEGVLREPAPSPPKRHEGRNLKPRRACPT